MKDIKLNLILEKDNSGNPVLYGCRGAGKGCSRNKFRKKTTHCDDCLLADPEETLEEFEKRLNQVN